MNSRLRARVRSLISYVNVGVSKRNGTEFFFFDTAVVVAEFEFIV